jgi:chromosome segregation ATPase
MIKKVFLIGLLVAGALFVAKTTRLFSYASTLWCHVAQESKNQIPTRFEIDRVRHELKGMDREISNMLHPIAEHMAAIKRLKKDIKMARANLAGQKNNILTMTRDLEGNPTMLVYAGEEYSAERVRRKLQRDFDSYKRCEVQLKSQERLLDAKEQALAGAREQLSRLIEKKREYEIRLAQLEADEETLQIARIGSQLPFDESRASEIEAALAEIEHRQEVQRTELELKNGPLGSDMIPVQNHNRSNSVNVDEIRAYFQVGPAAPAANANTASRK